MSTVKSNENQNHTSPSLNERGHKEPETQGQKSHEALSEIAKKDAQARNTDSDHSTGSSRSTDKK